MTIYSNTNVLIHDEGSDSISDKAQYYLCDVQIDIYLHEVQKIFDSVLTNYKDKYLYKAKNHSVLMSTNKKLHSFKIELYQRIEKDLIKEWKFLKIF